MNNSKYLCAIFVALLFSVSVITAQETSISENNPDKVILYNSQPVKVKLEGDKIKSFIGEASADYMEGYTLVDKKVAYSPSTPIQKVIESESTANANYAIVSNEKVLLNYKKGYATLDKAMINKLNEIALLLNSEPGTRVLMTAHLSDTDDKSSKLSDNRLGAATAYLKIKGVSLNRIQIETQSNSSLSDVIAVNYLR
jgi:outer membrane protein OmpA-like peptidoglycan-associated protein